MDFLKNAASQAMSGQGQNEQQSNQQQGGYVSSDAGQGGYGGGQQGGMVQEQQQMGQSAGGGGGGGFMDKIQNMGNNALGGGQAGEAKVSSVPFHLSALISETTRPEQLRLLQDERSVLMSTPCP
jgi:hypothetical protein